MILWLLLILIAAWMLLRYLPAGMDKFVPLPNVIALIPLLIVPLVGIAVLSVVLKNPAQFWVSVVLLAVQLAWAALYLVPVPDAVAAALGSPRQTMNSSVSAHSLAATPPRVKVLTMNALYGRADASAIMHEISTQQIDVLAAQEVSDEFVSRLHEYGILSELKYEQLGEKTDHDNAGYNAVWSRYPVTESGGALLTDMGSNTPWMNVDIDGFSVRVVSVHPYSPHRSNEQWQRDIAQLSTLATDASVPTVVMGDLNSSTFHPSLRATINTGLIDSSLESHSGFHPTFPASWPFVPPLIEIDHVLHTRELRAKEVATVRIPRTDHKALRVTLEWQ
ncbi:endonuclease/exonuclease/phosphatase family protein [Alloscardovia criceti]|uniref:endonuclease/exonuclease/phosphatase family protein n=1 Tax=Alloscardovia criceti TaxID=356828 RepID=UPI00037090C3|nr:endonuclease/exonuclease/phosphatase family protein [Alloscardovia criceti]